MEDNRTFRSAHTIAYTAVLAALAAILGTIGVYIPPLSLITNFLWLVPLIILTMQKGLKAGAGGLAVAGVLLGLLATPLPALFLLLEFSGLALFYGWSFRKQLPLSRMLSGGALIAVAGTLVSLVISLGIAGFSLTQMAAQVSNLGETIMELYRDTGMAELLEGRGMTPEEAQETLRAGATLVVSILPAMLLINAMVTALLSLIISRGVLRRLKLPVPEKLPPFSMWRLDWRLVWGVIAGLLLVLISTWLDWELPGLFGQNLLVLFGFLFGLSGLSIAIYGWKHTKLAPALKFLLLFGAVLYFQVFLYILIFMGVFDVFFDYRKSFDRKKGGKNDGSHSE